MAEDASCPTCKCTTLRCLFPGSSVRLPPSPRAAPSGATARSTSGQRGLIQAWGRDRGVSLGGWDRVRWRVGSRSGPWLRLYPSLNPLPILPTYFVSMNPSIICPSSSALPSEFAAPPTPSIRVPPKTVMTARPHAPTTPATLTSQHPYTHLLQAGALFRTAHITRGSGSTANAMASVVPTCRPAPSCLR